MRYEWVDGAHFAHFTVRRLSLLFHYTAIGNIYATHSVMYVIGSLLYYSNKVIVTLLLNWSVYADCWQFAFTLTSTFMQSLRYILKQSTYTKRTVCRFYQGVCYECVCVCVLPKLQLLQIAWNYRPFTSAGHERVIQEAKSINQT